MIAGSLTDIPANHVTRISLLGSGTGTTATRIMEAAGVTVNGQVCLVICNNSRAGVMVSAQDRGVPAAHLSTITHPDAGELDAAMSGALHDAGAELVVLAGYAKKVGPEVLREFSGRVVNTHPSMLPAYGGQGMYGDHVHSAVLAAGVATTGASVHVVTAEYDEGPVLAQTPVPVLGDDDVASLRVRVQAAEKQLLLDWLSDYCSVPTH